MIGSAKWDRSKGRPEPIAALNRVREEDNGEPLVSLLDVAPTARIVRESVIPYLRLGVAERLEKAARTLLPHYRLAVIDAWRPFQRQVAIHEWMTKCAREAFPDRPHAALMRTVNRWAAPVNQKAPPGHCTGAAVDVWLVDEHGEQIDVVSPYTRFSAAPTYALGLSETASRNRMALVEAMLEAGFSNCRDEWWHYSYGDAGWAVRMGLDRCIYGIADLPAERYEVQERLWRIAMAERPNPFLT